MTFGKNQTITVQVFEIFWVIGHSNRIEKEYCHDFGYGRTCRCMAIKIWNF